MKTQPKYSVTSSYKVFQQPRTVHYGRTIIGPHSIFQRHHTVFNIRSTAGHHVQVSFQEGKWDGYVKEWPAKWGDEEDWSDDLRQQRERGAVRRAIAAAKLALLKS